MDLTPRHEIEEPEEARRTIHRRRRWIILVIAVLLMRTGVVTTQGLPPLTLLKRRRAIEQRTELGTSRFRIQGRVPSSVQGESGVTTFQIVHECAVARSVTPVTHLNCLNLLGFRWS